MMSKLDKIAFGFFVLLWIVSWFLSIWIDKYRAELFITGLFSMFLSGFYHNDKKES